MIARVMLALAIVVAAPAAAGEIAGSRLALQVVGGRGAPSTLLAQRAIDREWGPSEDSTYVEIELPDYKSEGWAMALSGMVPGTGQLYLGERAGLLFMAAEVAGWTALYVFRDRATTARDKAHRYAGVPTDPSSQWSFDRYFAGSGQDTTALQSLYATDRDAFYHTIAYDDRYRIGWHYHPDEVRYRYREIENRWQRYLKRGRYATGLLVLNHVLAAVDGLRSARAHNAPLEQNLRLKLRGGLEPGGSGMTLALERSF